MLSSHEGKPRELQPVKFTEKTCVDGNRTDLKEVGFSLTLSVLLYRERTNSFLYNSFCILNRYL